MDSDREKRQTHTPPVLQELAWIGLVVGFLYVAGSYIDRRLAELEQSVQEFLRHDVVIDGLHVRAGPGFAVYKGDAGRIIVSRVEADPDSLLSLDSTSLLFFCRAAAKRTASFKIGNGDVTLGQGCVELNRIRAEQGWSV